LSFPTGKDAIRYRQELNQFRVALRNENTPGWDNYTGVGIYIDAKRSNEVILKPKSAQYADVMDAAGIPNSALPSPDQDTKIETSSAEQDFFADLKKLTRG